MLICTLFTQYSSGGTTLPSLCPLGAIFIHACMYEVRYPRIPSLWSSRSASHRVTPRQCRDHEKAVCQMMITLNLISLSSLPLLKSQIRRKALHSRTSPSRTCLAAGRILKYPQPTMSYLLLSITFLEYSRGPAVSYGPTATPKA
jgi:hypothetical protein